MAEGALKTMRSPDEVRRFEHGRMEVVNIGDGAVGRATFQPGWRWSNDVRQIAGTELCQAPHFIYQISGRMRVVMADGTEMESGPGDVAIIPPGHDAWVLGEEPVVLVDWGGASSYAKQ
jgi:hypothetical protein